MGDKFYVWAIAGLTLQYRNAQGTMISVAMTAGDVLELVLLGSGNDAGTIHGRFDALSMKGISEIRDLQAWKDEMDEFDFHMMANMIVNNHNRINTVYNNWAFHSNVNISGSDITVRSVSNGAILGLNGRSGTSLNNCTLMSSGGGSPQYGLLINMAGKIHVIQSEGTSNLTADLIMTGAALYWTGQDFYIINRWNRTLTLRYIRTYNNEGTPPTSTVILAPNDTAHFVYFGGPVSWSHDNSRHRVWCACISHKTNN